ncbi:MAG: energy-coupling factor transporter ATPase [Erysipelotrichaceae bacterium]|nr:energy-coupling factor transporter ATPase [Erysipelotrichaceae bacterium]
MSIEFRQLGHIYSPKTPFEYEALKDINLELSEGKITAIVGTTGSGKSTLIQHLNALLLPSSGELEIVGRVINSTEKPKHLKSLRKEVGLVFQFPEYQLFEETILKDVAFGPKNFGDTEEEANVKAMASLELVGLDSSYYERSPLELSGGQKRKVAIAGILAMAPQIVVLDEPTAGLDPQSAQEMMKLFKRINQSGKTILLVTHDMELVLQYCDEIVVIDKGQVVTKAAVKEFFKDGELCRQMNILPPAVVRLREALQAKGFELNNDIFDLATLAKEVRKQVKHHG